MNKSIRSLTPRNVAISVLSKESDAGGKNPARRPNVALCSHPDLIFSRLELLCDAEHEPIAQSVRDLIKNASPETHVRISHIDLRKPWQFDRVFDALFRWASNYPFDEKLETYFVHMSSGTHVTQICLYLLVERRWVKGSLLQTYLDVRASPALERYDVIDLSLANYDYLLQRKRMEAQKAVERLKRGIPTRNSAYNALIEEIESIASLEDEPILLTGETGVGKSELARLIYEVKRQKGITSGDFVSINCATLIGQNAMAELFGTAKGRFTHVAETAGRLKTAHRGVLFLDEIGELGLQEQAMLLEAIETKEFFPAGGDKKQRSDFQFIAGTNRDLAKAVASGAFRADLYARIKLWTFRLPNLRERLEDLEPNLDYELRRRKERIDFEKQARIEFLRFAASSDAQWRANFRDFNGAVRRMTAFASGGRITSDIVRREIARLKKDWGASEEESVKINLEQFIPRERLNRIDLWDKVQLELAIKVLSEERSLARAGRKLFGASRSQKQSHNDSARLRKALEKWGLDWHRIVNASLS